DRGRGCASFTFSIEAICFGKDAALPDVISKPPPPFPSTENKPVPLKTGEDEHYMLAIKQDLRGPMKMPYFLAVGEKHQAIDRYSQKEQDNEKEQETWTPDWRRLPREIKLKKANKKVCAKTKKANISDPKSNLVAIQKIEELEKKDEEEEKSKDEKDKTKDKKGEDDEAEEPEEYDEEEHEE
ncbi:RPC7 polymerase, partial [Lanius ludovicianus]|nr:RPC7 polymerase [Lanius ludovicianus]